MAIIIFSFLIFLLSIEKYMPPNRHKLTVLKEKIINMQH